jgi:transposase InsO family protein
MVGSVRVETTGGLFILDEVAYIPECPANLLSVSRATDRGFGFHFNSESCTIYHRGEWVMAAPRTRNGLYLLGNGSVELALGAERDASEERDAELWHRPFGHMGFNNLARLARAKMVTVCPVTPAGAATRAGDGVCEPCQLGKKTRNPFPTLDPQTRTTKPMEKVYCDVYGPLTPESIGGDVYILGILDDYTGRSFVKLLPTRAHVAEALTTQLLEMENESGNDLGILQTDGARELVGYSVTAFLRARGARHQVTERHTPQQNGAAERFGRSLMDRVRSILAESKLPKVYWSEAVYAANYVRNLCPVAGKSKTPWELWTGKKPDVSHLRVFGCVAYALIPKEERARSRKADARAERCIMVGYGQPFGRKGWRLLHADGSVSAHRDVAAHGAQGGTRACECRSEPQGRRSPVPVTALVCWLLRMCSAMAAMVMRMHPSTDTPLQVTGMLLSACHLAVSMQMVHRHMPVTASMLMQAQPSLRHHLGP